jgi:hypothetical protein
MVRWLPALILASAAFAQKQTQSEVPKLDAYREQALRNALRSADLQCKPKRVGPPSQKFVLVCAIPLTRVPADNSIDPKIRLESKSGIQNIDHMAFKAMPVCPENQPVR